AQERSEHSVQGSTQTKLGFRFSNGPCNQRPLCFVAFIGISQITQQHANDQPVRRPDDEAVQVIAIFGGCALAEPGGHNGSLNDVEQTDNYSGRNRFPKSPTVRRRYHHESKKKRKNGLFGPCVKAVNIETQIKSTAHRPIPGRRSLGTVSTMSTPKL